MSDIYYNKDNPFYAIESAANVGYLGNTNSNSKNTGNGIGLSILSTANSGLPSFTDSYNTFIAEKGSPKNYGEQLQKNLLYGDPNKGILGRAIDDMFNVPMKNLKNYYSNLENTNFNFSNTQDVINGYNTMPKATVYNNNHLKNDPVYGTVVPNIVQNTNNKIMNNFNNAVSNMQKQNNLNNLKSLYAMGGSLDYSLQNQYAINNYMNVMNKSKITSMPNSFQRPQFDSMNYFAMGGMPDFNEFNTGGTHEENKNGGILQGVDSKGVVNLAEQNEVKVKTKDGQDYILSARKEMTLSDAQCEQLQVPKGSTPAEAAKYLRKEYDENPNDFILKDMWENIQVPMLIEFNETNKKELALKEARKQGLTSSKMQGVSDQVIQDMYYNENPQEESSLQQGINPNIYNAFGGNIRRFDVGGFNVENLKYAPIAANIAGLAQNLFTPEDYSMPNRLQKEINALPRVSIPKNTNYMTYNPVDTNRYTNQYNAQTAAQRNAIRNTSNPNRNAALTSAIYNANIGYGDLVQAIEAQNTKEKQAVQQFNAGIDQQNIANQLQADNINQNYEQMRINGIMQEFAMRDAIQTARANAIQSNLKGLTDNMYNMYLDDTYNRQMDTWMQGQSIPTNLGMQVADGSITPEAAKQLLVRQYGEEKAKEIMSKYTLNGKPLVLTSLFGG